MSLEGKQLDRYHILLLLGSGGMGDVYLAEDPHIGQQVAVKVIRAERMPYPDEDSPKDALRLVKREAKAIVKLDHPHILPLYDYGEELLGTKSLIYLVMPYRPEGSLSDWLRRRATKELLSPQDVAQIISQAADALQHAHDHQVIHQDVKPSNFLVRLRKDTQNPPDLLLTDFGIARIVSATSSISQSVRGTPSYMAPEQWEGEPVPASDQYALAVMAYELLTGKLPFQGSPGKMMYQHFHMQPHLPSFMNTRLSDNVDAVLMCALAKQPEKRFSSVSDFADALHVATQSVQARNPLPPEEQREPVPSTLLTKETYDLTKPNTTAYLASDDESTEIKSVNKPVDSTSTNPLPRSKSAEFSVKNIPTLPEPATANKHFLLRRKKLSLLILAGFCALLLMSSLVFAVSLSSNTHQSLHHQSGKVTGKTQTIPYSTVAPSPSPPITPPSGSTLSPGRPALQVSSTPSTPCILGPPFCQGGGGNVTVQITAYPSTVLNGSGTSITVSTNEPGVTVDITVRNNTANPRSATFGPATTDTNGNATIPWSVNYSGNGLRSIPVTLVAVAVNQNGQRAISASVTIQVIFSAP